MGRTLPCGLTTTLGSPYSLSIEGNRSYYPMWPSPQHRSHPTLFEDYFVPSKSPGISIQRLILHIDEQCDEMRSPKVQPSTRPGIESATSWLAFGYLTNCAKLARSVYQAPTCSSFSQWINYLPSNRVCNVCYGKPRKTLVELRDLKN